MAKTNKPIDTSIPLAELTEEARKSIEGMDAELTRALENIDALKEIGIDASLLKDKILWARKAREIILKQFTKP